MREEVKKWLVSFWGKHGERETFALQATVMSVGFIIAGSIWDPLKTLVDVGITILTGVAMVFFNKIRSPKEEGQPNEEN